MERILVTGGDGLLAHHLKEIAPRDFELFFVDHASFDLVRPELMEKKIAELCPTVVINTAAYNFVEKCEQAHELSWAINATGPEILAKLCAEKNARLVHYSTDYVFDGKKKSTYTETDLPNPLNHYGAGKFGGERAALSVSPKNLVLRTSWVFGSHPTQTKSYVHSVLRAARSGNSLKVATDQISVPTFAGDLARWTIELVKKDTGGLFHAVNDEGASRYDWTKVILEEAARENLITGEISVEPVIMEFFKSPMRRPTNSVLSNEKLAKFLGRPLGSWRIGLRKMLAQEARH
jgi:dTDP-4-dehydrorhamnose reductase